MEYVFTLFIARQLAEGAILFSASVYARSIFFFVWPRTTKFCMVNNVGKGYLPKFLGVRNAPSKWLGPTAPIRFWDLNHAHTVWSRATKFGMVAHFGKRRDCRWSTIPLFQGAQHSLIFRDHHLRPYGVTHRKNLHGDQPTWEEIILWGWPRPRHWPKTSVTGMPTRDMFVVANLLV